MGVATEDGDHSSHLTAGDAPHRELVQGSRSVMVAPRSHDLTATMAVANSTLDSRLEERFSPRKHMDKTAKWLLVLKDVFSRIGMNTWGPSDTAPTLVECLALFPTLDINEAAEMLREALADYQWQNTVRFHTIMRSLLDRPPP